MKVWISWNASVHFCSVPWVWETGKTFGSFSYRWQLVTNVTLKCVSVYVCIYIYLLAYLHTYLLTYCKQQNPSWEANQFASSQEIPCILWNPKIHIYIHLLDYLLTANSRVLLEKLTGLQLVKKFPAFYRTRRFITALTSVRHLSLFWASLIQSIPLPEDLSYYYLSTCDLVSQVVSFPQVFWPKSCIYVYIYININILAKKARTIQT